MAEHRLFPADAPPEWTTPEWYTTRARASHLEEGVHRDRLHLAARMVVDLATEHDATSVVDLGAGDGGLLSLLAEWAPNLTAWGYDLQQTNVDGARERGVDVTLRNVVARVPRWGDVAVATEMLEHLADPHGFVRRVAKRSPVLVVSSPWTETPESHYDFHCWAWDQDGYRQLLEQAGLRVVRHETTGMFQVAAAVVPR